jgi:hypothetical protein
MGKTLILKSLLRSPNSISFMLIIFTFKLIQTIRILWFCHRSRPTPTPRAPRAMCGGGGGGSGSSGTTSPGGATTGNANLVPVRVRIRNPARRRDFTGNSAMATNMLTRRVAEALTLGVDPPSVMRSGAPKLMCVSWYCKGVCFEDCNRDHSTSSDSEADEFMGWCQAAYA